MIRRVALTALLPVVLLGSCASVRRPRVVSPNRRSQDAGEERLAGQRAADPHMHAEENEERFGLERARQLAREKKRKAAQKQAPAAPADLVKGKDGQTPPTGN